MIGGDGWVRGWRGLVTVGMFVLAMPVVTPGALLEGTRFEVSAQGLSIKGDIYGTTLPLADLVLASARLVDLDAEPQYRPWLKVNGIGLLHYRSGWHRLKNGERANVFLTRNQVVYIPTTQGFALLLTPDRPTEFLAALRKPAAAAQVFRIAKADGPIHRH